MIGAVAKKVGGAIRGKGSTEIAGGHVTYKITAGKMAIALLPALIGDGVQAAGNMLWFTGILGPLAWGLCFLVYLLVFVLLLMIFSGFGVSVFFGKHSLQKMMAALLATTFEMMPFTSAGFFLTFWAWRIISLSRQEDREAPSVNATINRGSYAKERMNNVRTKKMAGRAVLRGAERYGPPQVRAAAYAINRLDRKSTSVVKEPGKGIEGFGARTRRFYQPTNPNARVMESSRVPNPLSQKGGAVKEGARRQVPYPKKALPQSHIPK
jgi:hypothetical protein